MQSSEGGLGTDVVDDVLRASRVLVAVAARSMAGIGDDVTLPQYRALVVLASQGAVRPSELSTALGSHPSTITRLCDRLVTRGLVLRTTSPTSRREVRIALTPKGSRLVRRVTAARRAELERILDRLSERDQRSVARALRMFGDAADEPTESVGLG